MYTLYIANKNYSSWSLRPWILMTELQIPFEEVLVPFTPDWQPTDFLRFSPTGKVPCLQSENDVIWESLAIVEFLAENHTGIWPENTATRAWARCTAAEMHAGFAALRQICSMNCGLRVALNSIPPELAKDLHRLETLWAEGLKRWGGPFLTGKKFNAVDAFFCPVGFRIQSYGLKVSPEALTYAEQLRQLPGMQAWYNAGLAESWRDPSHEADVSQWGCIVSDLRTTV
ncbi:MAG: glutathione S-transferase family protein [Candidatus Sericytochromatia bacterium]